MSKFSLTKRNLLPRRKWAICMVGALTVVMVFNFKSCMETGCRRRSPPDTPCGRWKSSENILREARLHEPAIKLDPDKMLLPLLYNGPTNQLWGLRQAAYLAIALNRTLVLPPFHKHITDRSGPGEVIDANHRFQLESLSKMISIISPGEFSRRCRGKLDAVFPAMSFRSWMVDSLRAAENELGYKILRTSPSGKIDHKQLYDLPTIEARKFDGGRDELRSVYRTDARCVLYTFPLREIKLGINRTTTMEEYHQYEEIFEKSQGKVPDWFVPNALFVKMQAPEYVQDAAVQFLETTFGHEPYMALHWRYDEDDFKQFMCAKSEGEGNPNQAEMCRRVFEISPVALAHAIFDHINHVNEKSKSAISSIYISAPRDSILPFLRVLEDTLTQLQVKVFNRDHFDDFVRKSDQLSHCPFIAHNFNDFISLAEMEICARSRVFIRSTYSSWSDSVVLNRVLLHKKEVTRRFDIPAISLNGLKT